MENVIRFFPQNFTLTIQANTVSLLRASRPWNSRMIIEALFSYFILFSIALSYFYNFVVHVFLGEMTAHCNPGWASQVLVSRLSAFSRSAETSTCVRLPWWRTRSSCLARQARMPGKRLWFTTLRQEKRESSSIPIYGSP
jgi:hypothetical protein